MFQFSLYCLLSLISLVACLCNFLGRQFGTNNYFFIGSFYLEIVSNFSNILTFVIIIWIIFDKDKFSECYQCLINPIRSFSLRIRREKYNGVEDNNSLLISGTTTSSGTTNPSYHDNSSEVYASFRQISSHGESSVVSM